MSNLVFVDAEEVFAKMDNFEDFNINIIECDRAITLDGVHTDRCKWFDIGKDELKKLIESGEYEIVDCEVMDEDRLNETIWSNACNEYIEDELVILIAKTDKD